MPNVDNCVRYAEAALSSDETHYADLICDLDEQQKVNVFKNKSREEVRNILLSCRDAIKQCLNNKFYNGTGNSDDFILSSASNNNKKGADLYHILPNGEKVDIEVKFGLKTDRNIGMRAFKRIFNFNPFSAALSAPNRKKWISLYQQDASEGNQYDRLFAALNEAIESFNQAQQQINYVLPQEQQNFMEDFIINNVGGTNNKSRNILKFLLDGNTFRNFRQVSTQTGSWHILPVKKLSSEVKRVNIIIFNPTTNVQIRYTLNWKNNYHVPGRGEVSAKLGFGTPNWNVWVDAYSSLS